MLQRNRDCKFLHFTFTFNLAIARFLIGQKARAVVSEVSSFVGNPVSCSLQWKNRNWKLEKYFLTRAVHEWPNLILLYTASMHYITWNLIFVVLQSTKQNQNVKGIKNLPQNQIFNPSIAQTQGSIHVCLNQLLVLY